MHVRSKEKLSESALKESNDYFEKADYAQALNAAERANQLVPNQVKVLLRIGEIYVKQENYAEALPYLEQINELEPTNPKKDYLLGRVYYLLGETQSELESAAFYLGRAASEFRNVKSSMYTLHAGLADTVAAIDDKDIESANQRNSRAVQYFSLAIEENVFDKPMDVIVAYLYRAQAYYGLGQYKESIWDMGEAKKLNVDSYPRLTPIWEEVQELLTKKGYGEQLNKLLDANKRLASATERLEQIKKAREENDRRLNTTKEEVVTITKQIKDKEVRVQHNQMEIQSKIQQNEDTLQGIESVFSFLQFNNHPIYRQPTNKTANASKDQESEASKSYSYPFK